MWKACQRNDLQSAFELLEQGALLREPSPALNGDLLLAACRRGSCGGVAALLAAGAGVERCVGHVPPYTPLISAVEHRHLPLIRQLLAAGARPDTAAMHTACMGGSLDLAEVLAAASPDPHALCASIRG